MGGYHWDKKDTVEDCKSVSIAFLKKHGYFFEPDYMSGTIRWRNSFGEQTASISIAVSTLGNENYVRFQYTTTDHDSGEKTEYDYNVQLTTTKCNFGGVRYWFICPLSKNGAYCGRRVAKLYKAPGADYFGCRHCYDLSYESRNEPRFARPGGLYYPLLLDRRYEELRQKVKRWTYRGKPTKKARKLHALEREMEYAYSASSRLLKQT